MRKRQLAGRLGTITLALALAGSSMMSVYAQEDDEGDVFYIDGTQATADEGAVDNDEDVYYYDYDEEGDLDGEADLIEDDGNEAQVSDGELLDDVLAQEAYEAQQESERQAREAQLLSYGIIPTGTASAEHIEELLEELQSQVSPTGSDGELVIGAYIESVMSDLGYTVQEQSFHEGFLNEDYIDVPGVNIIAERGADSAQRSNDIVIIAGHYDSKTDPEDDDPYANDKSAAVVMLEAARLVSGLDTDVDICFLFLSGEEDGFYGSQAFAQHMTQEQKDRVKAVICVGTVGTTTQADYCIGTYAYETGDAGSTEHAEGAETSESTEASEAAGSEIVRTVLKGAAGVEARRTLEAQAQAQTEGQEEAQTQAQTEEQPSAAAAAVTWKDVAGSQSSASAFAQEGMDAVCLFQDVSGLYAQEEEQETQEAQSEETEVWTETEEAAHLYLAAEGGETFSTQDLAYAADVLAQTAGWYMYAQRAQ